MAVKRSVFVTVFFAALYTVAAFAQPFAGSFPLQRNPDLAVTEFGAWTRVQNGLELRSMTLARFQPRQVVVLQLARFDTRWATPHIVHSLRYNLREADVRTLAEKSGAVAAINGSYFDEKRRPLGYLKALTQKLNSQVSKSSLFTGIFGVKDRQPFIVHRDRFDPGRTDEGLQAGPLLLSDGQALRITRGAEKQSRRALIGVDRNRRWIIAAADSILGGLNWAELQELFGSEQWGIQAVELLNLDGGGSAQLYVKGSQAEAYIPGGTGVPVAVGFFPKTF